MSGPRSQSVAMVSSMTVVFLFLFLQSAAAADQETGSVRPDLATIVKHISEAQLQNRERVKAYSVTREYKVFGGGAEQPRTDVVAHVNFLPPSSKNYDIDQSTGGMGEKVIRHILDHEVDAARDPKLIMINDQNYDFEYLDEATLSGTACYKLGITPRHDRKELLKATIWVDKNSYRILRMEGEPSKSLSFWVKDVHLVLQFGEVAGMWLQTESLALAHLRFGGEYKITSQDLNYDISHAVAVNVSARHGRHSSAMMAASVR